MSVDIFAHCSQKYNMTNRVGNALYGKYNDYRISVFVSDDKFGLNINCFLEDFEKEPIYDLMTKTKTDEMLSGVGAIVNVSETEMTIRFPKTEEGLSAFDHSLEEYTQYFKEQGFPWEKGVKQSDNLKDIIMHTGALNNPISTVYEVNQLPPTEYASMPQGEVPVDYNPNPPTPYEPKPPKSVTVISIIRGTIGALLGALLFSPIYVFAAMAIGQTKNFGRGGSLFIIASAYAIVLGALLGYFLMKGDDRPIVKMSVVSVVVVAVAIFDAFLGLGYCLNVKDLSISTVLSNLFDKMSTNSALKGRAVSWIIMTLTSCAISLFLQFRIYIKKLKKEKRNR